MTQNQQEKKIEKMILILKYIKSNVKPNGSISPINDDDFYQLYLLRDSGYIEFNDKNTSSGYVISKIKITNSGHAFIETLGDNKVLEYVKEETKSAGRKFNELAIDTIFKMGQKYLESTLGL
ncbi:hypothetical protein L2Z53_05595 [Macrococcoides canis]|uniref:hypothetical protein n=1 Tax=Macrococcoides canis TaxID=1855823 RepID=UPI001F161242|nr:hypothetical protein [Macrococcus canis]UJS28824.1 hypothetical protein L2Z53_05595 [Macrococcus canis]